MTRKQIATVVESATESRFNNASNGRDIGECMNSSEEEYMDHLEIKGFCIQPEFILVEGNAEDRPITYKADFIIFNKYDSFEIVDVKGFESEQWKGTFKQFRLKYQGLKLKIIK